MRKFLACTLLLLMSSISMAEVITSVGCSSSSTCSQSIPTIECGACTFKATSQTFFSFYPTFQIGRPELETIWRDRMQSREDGRDGTFQFVPFGSRTTNAANLASYFMPFKPQSALVLDVRETENTDPQFRNSLLARYFNIETVKTSFHSQITFNPVHVETGMGISYKQGFAERTDGRAFWFQINMPISHVKNSLGFSEVVINDGGGALPVPTECSSITQTASPIASSSSSSEICLGSSSSSESLCFDSCNPRTFPVVTTPVANMVEAFKQPGWDFGRIDHPCGSSKTSISNIDVVIGFESVRCDRCNLENFIGVSLPTGNRVHSRELFEPIVGFNKNIGFMFGSHADLEMFVSKNGKHSLWLDYAINGIYFAPNTQTRLMDLKYKPWSRYMRMYANLAQAEEAANTMCDTVHTPGVDILAQRVKVHPGFIRLYNSGVVYNCGGFEGEVGYSFLARSAECISLKCEWQEGPALVANNLDITGVPGSTDRVQMINDDFDGLNAVTVAFYNNNLIQSSDLDLDSAAHPSMATHTVYLSSGYCWNHVEFPPFVGIGGSYEFSRDNTGPDRWTIWGKFGLSF